MPSPARLVVPAALALVGCGAPHAVAGAPIRAAVAYDETGTASWYGDELAGARTASGARFDPAGLTAAHRSLPFGTRIEVTSLDTGRRVVALVNDRGPGRRDRLLDLSRGAAQQLGFAGRSTARVRVRVLQPDEAPSPAVILAASDNLARPALSAPSLDPRRRYVLRIATFSSRPRADALAARLDAHVVAAGSLWRVTMGPYKGEAAKAARDVMAAQGYGDAAILPAD